MLADNPDQPIIHELLAIALCDDGAYHDAIAAADAALARGHALPGARLARARAQAALCRFEAAVADFEAVVALAPVSSGVFLALGNTYAELARFDEAASCLRAAIAVDPSGAEAFASLGSVHARSGRTDEAIWASRQALTHNPAEITAHRNLAVLLAPSAPELARRHRNAAFLRRQIFFTAAPPDARTVLVLTCVAAASLPLEHLLPRTSYAQIHWFIDHATPDQDREIPPHDLIFNAIGDPDLMPPLRPPVRRLLVKAGKPSFNDPERVRLTHRSALPALLDGIADIVVPNVLRIVGNARDAPAWRSCMALPVLVRPVGSHGGDGLHKAGTAAEVETATAGHEASYLTEFIDSRKSQDGYFRKYRAIFVDRVPYPYHLAIGPHWMTHYWTAGMETDPVRRDEEQNFLANPESAIGTRAMTALAAIGVRLDLDYAGIDFAILPDGRLLVFEANATMLVHPEQNPIFAYKNQSTARILAAFETMLTRSQSTTRPVAANAASDG